MNKKLINDKATVKAMIAIYCRAHHNPDDTFCCDCNELLEYSFFKLEKCPFGEEKPSCSKCTVHCYKQAMRDRIKPVMRYSGPKMLYNHPGLAVRYMLERMNSKQPLLNI